MTTCGGGRPERNGVKELVLVVTNPGITLFVRMAVGSKVKPTFLIRCISLLQKVMDQTAVSSPGLFVVGLLVWVHFLSFFKMLCVHQTEM